MLTEAPIGTVCAFAGQLDPVTGGANNIWSSSGCSSANSESGKVNTDVPLTHVEVSGWMLCDGRSLSPASYPELYGVLGYLYGNDNGNFRIPDYRGLFLRGVDAGSGMDPDAKKRLGPNGSGASSGVGSLQCDALEDHTHTYKSVTLSGISQQGNAAGQAASDEPTSNPDSPARTSTETRPKNVAVNYIIKFR